MADKVQRYGQDAWRMITPIRNGVYVLHSDYAKLETELRDTRRALDLVCETLGTFEANYWIDKARERTEEIKGKLAE